MTTCLVDAASAVRTEFRSAEQKKGEETEKETRGEANRFGA